MQLTKFLKADTIDVVQIAFGVKGVCVWGEGQKMQYSDSIKRANFVDTAFPVCISKC